MITLIYIPVAKTTILRLASLDDHRYVLNLQFLSNIIFG